MVVTGFFAQCVLGVGDAAIHPGTMQDMMEKVM